MPLDIIEEFEALVAALNGAGVPYAVCGGLAVNIHGHVRSTRDIDLLLPAQAVPAALRVAFSLGFTIHAGPIPFAVGTPAEREIHRATKIVEEDLLTIDLLLVSPALQNAWSTRERVEWRGRVLPVVSRAGLVEMKRLAGRHQDFADIEHLEGGGDD